MKKRLLTVAACCLAALIVPSGAKAESGVEASVGLEVLSNYIWRGQDLGGAAFQPTLSVGYKGLSLSCFGSYGFVDRNDTKELDFTLAYTVKGFTVGMTDYYCISGQDNCPGSYFNYKRNRTAHVFEANVGYDFGFLAVNWFTNFAGADGVNGKGKRAYSSYLELTAPFKLAKLDWEAAIGVVPYKTSFYADADGFAVTRVSLKAGYDLKINDKFHLPLSATVTANPSTKKMYFTAGVAILMN